MKNIKHSKYKNPGILFELLTRQITVDLINERDKSPAINIIQKYFGKNTELAKEHGLYSALLKEHFSSEAKAENLIETVIDARKTRINEKKLANEKYNLVAEIKKNYPLEEFFQSRLNNYTELASVYKIFKAETDNVNYNPADYVRSKYTIVEHITKSPVQNKSDKIENDVIAEYKQQSKDLKMLAQKIMTEKFNDKYSILLPSQKKLIKRYINNISNTNSLRKYVNEEVEKLKGELAVLEPRIQNEVTKIKVTESLKLMENLKSGKLVSDDQVTSLLMYYQLVEEIKDVLEN